MMYDGLFCAFDQCAMGAGHREVRRLGRARPRAPGRDRRQPATSAARAGHQGRPASPTRSCRSRSPSAGATRWSSTPTRACVRDDRGVARQAAPGVRQGRQHHGRQRLADLRRRLGADRGHVQGQGRRARTSPRWARSSATARWPDPTRRCSPSRRGPSMLALGGCRPLGRRHRSVRAQRGVRRGRPGLDGRARHQRRHRQRQRRGHRPRPPGGHVRQPPGPHVAPRAEAPWWWHSVPPRCAVAAVRATPSSCAPCSAPPLPNDAKVPRPCGRGTFLFCSAGEPNPVSPPDPEAGSRSPRPRRRSVPGRR